MTEQSGSHCTCFDQQRSSGNCPFHGIGGVDTPCTCTFDCTTGEQFLGESCPRHGTPPPPVAPVTETHARAAQLLADAGQIIGAGGERHKNYGAAIDNFTTIGRLWAPVLGLAEVTPEQVAICSALIKVGRLIHSPGHRDSWVDGLGYLALGGDIAATPGRHP